MYACSRDHTNKHSSNSYANLDTYHHGSLATIYDEGPLYSIASFDINAININIGPATGFPDIISESSPHSQHMHSPRAQIDTGAFVTCTDLLHMLHGYTGFSESSPCPVRLLPATVGSDATPKGYGFLHVPARKKIGFLSVRTFYTPILRTTVIDERDLIQAAGTHLTISPRRVLQKITIMLPLYMKRHIKIMIKRM